ncbi:hypothetical protein LBMAG56_43190 [Verrucomicrobiota bacterium]|nr:hypothetical protein LBMAG56_43190 [Verrucomicrobiota bacterium]
MKPNQHNHRKSRQFSPPPGPDTGAASGNPAPPHTETQKLQKLRDSEPRSFGETEHSGIRDTHAVEESDDLPPLSARIATLPEAVAIALTHGFGKDCLFVLARAVKAFEATCGKPLPEAEWTNAFNLWWHQALPHLPEDAPYDEYLLDFLMTYEKVRAPLGANHLQEAIRRATCNPPPPEAERFANSPRLQQLVAVCYQLHRLAEGNPFFLSVRAAAGILDTNDLHRASKLLMGLEKLGILEIVAMGQPGQKKATRFRYRPSPEPAAGRNAK